MKIYSILQLLLILAPYPPPHKKDRRRESEMNTWHQA